MHEALQAFDPISLTGLDNVKLLDRIDAKHLLAATTLETILHAVENDYYALEIDGQRTFPYSSQYLDTKDDELYLHHHNGRLNRVKIRFRTYLANDKTYLEVKHKEKNGRTRKERMLIQGPPQTVNGEERTYLLQNTIYKPEELIPVLQTQFTRITLASKKLDERATIDYDLTFTANGKTAALHNIAVIETKKASRTVKSPLQATLREMQIPPSGFSKYCLGRAMTDEDIKKNNFKEYFLRIEKINRQS